MAYAIPSGAVLEVTAEYHVNGQLCMNVWHYYMERDGGITDGREAALNALTILNPVGKLFETFRNCISDTVDDILFYAQWITPQRYAYVVTPVGPQAGTVASVPYPQNVSVACTMKGDQADKHNLGRKAMGGVPEDFGANGLLTNLAMVAYQVFCDECRESFVGVEGEDYSPVIFNRATPELSPVITESFPQPSLRVERRRTVGVGA